MSTLSLLQLRNLTTNRIAEPKSDPAISDEDALRYLKIEFNVTVPVVSVQSQVNALQTIQTLGEFTAALGPIQTAVNTLIPPVTAPKTFWDIQTELNRIILVPNPIDQQILFLDYIPYISPYVATDTLRSALGTPGQRDAIVNFVTDFGNRLRALSINTPPQFNFLVPLYESYRKSIQLARSTTEVSDITTRYQSILTQASLTVPEWPFPTSESVLGFYTPSFVPTSNTFSVYFTESTPGLRISKGWLITGLEGIYGNVKVVGYTANVYGDAVISIGPPAISFPFVSNATVVSDQPNPDIRPSSIMRLTLTPPVESVVTLVSNVTAAPSFGYYDPRYFDDTKIIGTPGELRDLNSNVTTTEGAEVYHTVMDRGAGTGALMSLAALGSQDKYMFGGESKWTPRIKQHTPFVLSQRLSLPLSNIGGYLGKTVQVDIFPRECADLFSNMYLQCALPALPSGCYYTELVGRAIIQKVEFIVDGNVIESLTDDWYIIHDQLTLDADEKLGMYQLISNGTPEGSNVIATSQINLLVPLEFFFCHRFTHMRENKKPYFPVCALTQSSIAVRFTFNNKAWITNAATSVDLINPRLLIEEITLSPEERMYYKSRPFDLRIPRVWKEAVQTYANGTARINLTAKFPVSMAVWFIRNKTYENTSNVYYASRYTFGYTSQYIVSAVPVTFFNGVQLKYIDTIQSATLYLNNNNVLSNFPGGLYYTFKQAIDHGLSVPTKSLYMYCFSEKPLLYNHDGGSLDFTSLNSQTTHLDLTFDPAYASQISSSFSLYMFYYGYTVMHIEGGRITSL